MLPRMFARLALLLLLAVPLAAPAAESKPRTGPVATGEMAPDFTLLDQNGQKRSLSAERGQRPVVLVFYRGHW